jgi:hypothetical protein
MATINGTNYNYTAAVGDTVAVVANTLAPLVDVNAAVDCASDGTKITCTASVPGTAFTFGSTVIDTTSLSPTQYTPASGATGVAISAGTVAVTFSRSVDAIVDPTKIDIVNNSTGVTVKNAVTVVGGELNIGYDALANSTTYRININANAVTDVNGVMNANGWQSTFSTTAVTGVGTFGVISTTMTKLTGTADNTYANGWEWVIRITLPTDQNDLALKFNNWTSGSNTLATASNMEYYSEQIASGTGSSASPIAITAANTYPSNVTISTDADATTDGIQTDIHVKVKIPVSTTSGSYSTSYRVNYE